MLSIGGIYSLWCRYCDHQQIKNQSLKMKEFHNRPLLLSVSRGRGTIQGCRWATNSLKMDEDGDWAHEFLGPFDNPNYHRSSVDTMSTKEVIKQDDITNGLNHQSPEIDKERKEIPVQSNSVHASSTAGKKGRKATKANH